MKKIFVLDTNVILHDNECIYRFQEHDVVIPVTVLEELDHFKKGNETLNFHAREFARDLDALSGDKLFNGGVSIGKSLGKISIVFDQELDPDLAFNFSNKVPDHLILNTAYQLSKKYPQRQVILVSKDVNLRMKAKSVGLIAQDYMNDQVKDISALYTGHQVIDNLPDDMVSAFYRAPYEIDRSQLDRDVNLRPHEFLIMRNAQRSALATYDAFTEKIRRVEKGSVYGIMPRNSEQTFALSALVNPQIPLVSISGKAGTGKTLLALAAALEKRSDYRQIFLARPIVPLSNKDIGFLPGDIQSKLEPYMQPLFDNLGVIQSQYPDSDNKNRRIKELLDEEKLVISPLTYIRGRSLVKIYFIVDEAQNLTPHEVKTIISREGEGTKLVFTCDIYQID
ncbi:MAG: PhoH family protein, partial [Calditrichota bacterium]